MLCHVFRIGTRATLWAILSLSLSFARNAMASAYQGYITDIYYLNNLVYLYLENGSYVNNQCGGPATYFMLIVNPANDQGKAQLSLAVMAKATGVAVYGSGNGDCTTAGTPSGNIGETVAGLNLENQ